MARFVMEQISKSGKVVRGYLGVVIQNVIPQLAKQFGFSGSLGALTSEIEPGGPGDRAGLQRGDIAVDLNGKPVTDGRALELTVSRISPGSMVNLEIVCAGQQKQVTVTLGEVPAKPPAQ